MTTNRKPSIQVKIHHGKIVPIVKAGHWLHVEGFTALVIIAIITVARIVKIIGCLVWSAGCLIVPPIARLVPRYAPRLTRLVLRYAAGIYLAFQAFYTH